VGSTGHLLLVWLLAGVITITAALSYGELAGMMPRAGGQYVYLREGLSPLWGFLYGWTVFLVIQTGTIAAVVVAFSKFLAVLWPGLSPDVWLSLGRIPAPGDALFSLLGHPPAHAQAIEIGVSWQRLMGIGVVLLLTWVNARGVRTAAWIQTVFTAAKVLALAALVLLGLSVGRNAAAIAANFGAGRFWAGGPLTLAVLPVVGAAMVGSLFSSDAWNNVAFAATEVKNPRRNLPLALGVGTAVVCLLYLLANVAYLNVLPLGQIQGAAQDRVGTAAMQVVFGRAGLAIMAIAFFAAAAVGRPSDHLNAIGAAAIANR